MFNKRLSSGLIILGIISIIFGWVYSMYMVTYSATLGVLCGIGSILMLLGDYVKNGRITFFRK
jgi:tetrahydromethanopterin S-methyltransferase subunit F